MNDLFLSNEIYLRLNNLNIVLTKIVFLLWKNSVIYLYYKTILKTISIIFTLLRLISSESDGQYEPKIKQFYKFLITSKS